MPNLQSFFLLNVAFECGYKETLINTPVKSSIGGNFSFVKVSALADSSFSFFDGGDDELFGDAVSELIHVIESCVSVTADSLVLVSRDSEFSLVTSASTSSDGTPFCVLLGSGCLNVTSLPPWRLANGLLLTGGARFCLTCLSDSCFKS